jgi:hypothetical protein
MTWAINYHVWILQGGFLLDPGGPYVPTRLSGVEKSGARIGG